MFTKVIGTPEAWAAESHAIARAVVFSTLATSRALGDSAGGMRRRENTIAEPVTGKCATIFCSHGYVT